MLAVRYFYGHDFSTSEGVLDYNKKVFKDGLFKDKSRQLLNRGAVFFVYWIINHWHGKS